MLNIFVSKEKREAEKFNLAKTFTRYNDLAWVFKKEADIAERNRDWEAYAEAIKQMVECNDKAKKAKKAYETLAKRAV